MRLVGATISLFWFLFCSLLPKFPAVNAHKVGCIERVLERLREVRYAVSTCRARKAIGKRIIKRILLLLSLN